MNIDAKLTDIDERLEEINSEICRLSALKKKLCAAKEKLKDQKYLEAQNELSKNDWSQEVYPWSGTIKDKLSSTFNLKEFRPKQLETINATMSKIDVILVAPTGGGKSLCFQLPAVCDSGVTLVVSPLISLMEDQLYALKKRGIPAEILSSSTDQETSNRVHKFLNDPGYSSQLKLLYVTPERMSKSKRLMSALQKSYQNKKLERIAIDEVHCCSVLGHDFRPDYKYLSTLKTLFPNCPIIGVTATASRKVLVDVQKILNVRGCLVFNTPFNRPNLFYSILEKSSDTESVYDQLADLLKNRFKGQSGIIYTFSIKDTETLTSELLQRDCKVRPYHASLEYSQRSKVYKNWMDNEIQAVVATIAFGLGIDKPDVRFIIHHTLSKSMENFYQESGRAGRDGNYAECILMFKFTDIFKISTMTFVEKNGLKNAYSMVKYCIDARKCRRDIFSQYFSEVWSDKNCGKMCDHCYYGSQARTVFPPKMDLLNHFRTLTKILDKAQSMDIKMTALKLIDTWFHRGPAKLRLEIPPPTIDRFFAEQIIAFLLLEDYLREDFHYTAYSTISYIQRGPRSQQDGEIEFYPSRIFELPSVNELKGYFNPENRALASTSETDNGVPKKELNDSVNSRKRRISSSSESSDDEAINSKRSFRDDSIEKLIERKVELKLRKILGSPKHTLSTSTISDDECVVVTPKMENHDVIEID